MAAVNKAIIVGHLGQDPDVKTTRDGKKIVNLSVATSERWTDKQTGEVRENTEWHRIVIFNDRLADVAERYLHKGSRAYIEGSLQTRKWTDKNGVDRYTTEIALKQFRGELVLLSDKDQKGSDTKRQEAQQAPLDFEDGIPF